MFPWLSVRWPDLARSVRGQSPTGWVVFCGKKQQEWIYQTLVFVKDSWYNLFIGWLHLTIPILDNNTSITSCYQQSVICGFYEEWESLYSHTETWDFDCCRVWWHPGASPPLSVCPDRLSPYCPRLVPVLSLYYPRIVLVLPHMYLSVPAAGSMGRVTVWIGPPPLTVWEKLSENGRKVTSELVPKNCKKKRYTNLIFL